MNQSEVVKWKCPYCGGKNIDDREATVVPLCDICQRDVHWNEIKAEKGGQP